MRIGTGKDIRSWSQWVDLAQRMQKSQIVDEAQEQQAVSPLDSNVIGGPLDGAKMPNGTRKGLKYEWDGERWCYVY